MGSAEMARIDVLEVDFKELEAELRECREQHATARIDVAALKATVDALQKAQTTQAAQITELHTANAALLARLLDGPTGPGGRAAREDARFRLLIDKLGTPIGKALVAGSALVLAALASWWAGRFGLGIPATIATPTAFVAPAAP